MNDNIILNVDSYKASHFLQYPPGTSRVSSYIESRGGEYDDTVFFGLQMFLKRYLGRAITTANVDQAEFVMRAHGVPFNRAGWDYIVEKHRGRLPIKIQAVREGSVVPTKNVLVQLVNTDPNVPWLTSYLETALLRAVWYPTTVATLSRECKKLLRRYLQLTADTVESLPFMLHDFGARGTSSEETAAIGGLANLVNFSGTDTLSSVLAGAEFYGELMAGFSIPAAEHSTVTSWGKGLEQAAYANMIEQFGGTGKVFAVVSDSYDIWNAIDNLWGAALKERVATNGGRLVVRPDSGDPVTVVKTAIEKLMAKFGYSINSKGYRVLPDYIRVIQGDGVSLKTIGDILEALKADGISADNIAFGMGGELLQKVNRDTLKFAMKASSAEVNGQWRDVFKAPVTDASKRSKKGRLALVSEAGSIRTITEQALGSAENLLVTVYENGELLVDDAFSEIRARAAE